jgi:hypothetical protein
MFPTPTMDSVSVLSEHNIDSMHSEKIAELLETVENLKVEICSRDQHIELLRSQVTRLNVDI